MHELSIATQLLDSILAVAADNRAERVDEVEVLLGAMRLVVPEALEQAFEIVAEGTLAQGAQLKLTEVGLRGRCRGCGHEFEPGIGNFACPACGRADVDIVQGDDIILKSVVCTTPDEGENGA